MDADPERNLADRKILYEGLKSKLGIAFVFANLLSYCSSCLLVCTS
jgi:hypothetical protein